MPSCMAEPTQRALGASSLIPPRRSVGLNLLTQKKEESLEFREEKETSPSFPQILRKLRALPVGKLQSSFNVAGSWADMVGWKYENMKIS